MSIKENSLLMFFNNLDNTLFNIVLVIIFLERIFLKLFVYPLNNIIYIFSELMSVYQFRIYT